MAPKRGADAGDGAESSRKKGKATALPPSNPLVLQIPEGDLKGERMACVDIQGDHVLYVLLDQDEIADRHPGVDPDGHRWKSGDLVDGASKEEEALARGGLQCQRCGIQQHAFDGWVDIELGHFSCDSITEKCPTHLKAKRANGAVKPSRVGSEMRSERCQTLCITCDRIKSATAAREASCCWLRSAFD